MKFSDIYLQCDLRDEKLLLVKLEEYSRKVDNICLNAKELLTSDNWRSQIVGAVITGYYNCTSNVEELWSIVDRKKQIAWQCVVILKYVDIGFQSRCFEKCNELLRYYSSKSNIEEFKKNIPQGVAWLPKYVLAMVYCLGEEFVTKDLKELYGLDNKAESHCLGAIEDWDLRIKHLRAPLKTKN